MECPNEHLLGHIGGFICIGQEQISQPKHSLLMLIDELQPGGLIAPARPVDKIKFAHVSLSGK
jgi:hypothetical protein